MFDDAHCFGLVPPDIVLKFPPHHRGLVKLCLGTQLWTLIRAFLPGLIASPLPLATGPPGHGDLEDDIVGRRVMRHHRTGSWVVGVEIQWHGQLRIAWIEDGCKLRVGTKGVDALVQIFDDVGMFDSRDCSGWDFERGRLLNDVLLLVIILIVLIVLVVVVLFVVLIL